MYENKKWWKFLEFEHENGKDAFPDWSRLVWRLVCRRSCFTKLKSRKKITSRDAMWRIVFSLFPFTSDWWRHSNLVNCARSPPTKIHMKNKRRCSRKRACRSFLNWATGHANWLDRLVRLAGLLRPGCAIYKNLSETCETCTTCENSDKDILVVCLVVNLCVCTCW